MAGGLMDDPDMRYGFAIDRLFSRRKLKVIKRCACGEPLGIGTWANHQTHCNACRDKRARRADAGNAFDDPGQAQG